VALVLLISGSFALLRNECELDSNQWLFGGNTPATYASCHTCHTHLLSRHARSLVKMRERDLDYKYGVAMTSRLLEITGLFCKTALQKRLYSAQETKKLKEPTNRDHLIIALWRENTCN